MATTSDLPPHVPEFDFEDDNDYVRSEESGVEHRDDAQAVLQPSMSAAATHLTLLETGEDEKIAALKKRPTADSNYFASDDPIQDEDEEELDGEDSDPASLEEGGESTPESADTPRPSPPVPVEPETRQTNNLNLGKLPAQRLARKSSAALPSPWVSGPRELVIATPVADKPPSRPRPSSTFLESAFGGDRQPNARPRRSGSVGQEAFRRLQRVLPSPTSLSFNKLSSFHGPFRSSSPRPASAHSDDGKESPRQGSPLSLPSWSLRRKTMPREATQGPHSPPARSILNLSFTPTPISESTPSQKPPLTRDPSIASRRSGSVLRRVASDDSLLYHVLSPQSSIDDGQFNDVHEMVNLRFKAIKESLPSLPKVNPSWRSSLNLSSFTSLSLTDSFASKDAVDESVVQEPSPHPATPHRATGSSSSILPPKDPLDAALEGLTGDVVVLGGYRGSILRSAEPPHQQVWAPVKVGLNLRKVNLEVGLNDEDEENMSNSIRPSGMLKNMGPVDISRKFIRRLKTCENAQAGKLRVWDYGYDWRLSPHRLSAGLCEFLARLPCNQSGMDLDSRGALVIAHSLGGLITRHAVNQRPELFSGVLYAGVPQRTINILGPLRNGDAVLLNEKLLTAAVNFSIRTSFVFLPEDGFAFVDKETGEPYRVDFYDAEEWARWKISPCVSTPLKQAPTKPQSSSFASLLPSSLRARANSKSDAKVSEGIEALDRTVAPQLDTRGTANGESAAKESSSPGSEERQRYMEYLTRTLARTKKFRAELAHNPSHESKNIYPPMAVLYGKSVPTVYAAQVHGLEGITQTDAYSDLLFRAGDGVTLAKQAMLPKGYSVVKGGKVLTDRGHITMLGDLPAVGRALGALRRGRAKGIGLGEERKRRHGHGHGQARPTL